MNYKFNDIPESFIKRIDPAFANLIRGNQLAIDALSRPVLGFFRRKILLSEYNHINKKIDENLSCVIDEKIDNNAAITNKKEIKSKILLETKKSLYQSLINTHASSLWDNYFTVLSYNKIIAPIVIGLFVALIGLAFAMPFVATMTKIALGLVSGVLIGGLIGVSLGYKVRTHDSLDSQIDTKIHDVSHNIENIVKKCIEDDKKITSISESEVATPSVYQRGAS